MLRLRVHQLRERLHLRVIPHAPRVRIPMQRIPNNPPHRLLIQRRKMNIYNPQGNPFFVVQLLKSLHRSGHISFEFSNEEGEGRWRFNLTSIEAEDLPPTVVDLLVAQMLKLPETTCVVMMLASCIGTERISLGLLAMASGKRVEATSRDIWGALEAGLLMAGTTAYISRSREIIPMSRPRKRIISTSTTRRSCTRTMGRR